MEVTLEMTTLEEVEVSLEKGRTQIILEENEKSSSMSRSGSGMSTNRDRIRCFTLSLLLLLYGRPPPHAACLLYI